MVLMVSSKIFADTTLFETVKPYEYKLKNGLQIVVIEDHSSPMVSSQLWYNVGSKNEQRGETGLAHALEHMMFKGTTLYPKNKFMEMVIEKGGHLNAFTSYDYTAYYENIAKEHLELLFELESDRLQNLQFDEKEILKELQVIKEERRLRTEDNPKQAGKELFYAAAYLGPYQHPVVGWMSDIDNFSIEDLKKWYQTWYVPNNAILVVVGDVQAAAVKNLAEQYFANIPAKPLPLIKPIVDLPTRGMRRVNINIPSQVSYLFMAYNLPNFKSVKDIKEAYALSILAEALNMGESGRLTKTLIHQQPTASQISVFYNPFSQYNGLLEVNARPLNNDISLANLEQKILLEIERFKNEPLSETELKRIKTNVMASYIYQLDSMYHRGQEIGALLTMGYPIDTLESYVKNIQEVTSGAIQAVAKKYLTPERLTIGHLEKSEQTNISTPKDSGDEL
ncbi:MAG: peptidase [Francisellaceae bacterium]|nr:peptidase [Francisellaceae bacterium]